MILIGAVAIAFILLTLVVLFNGVLFTETVSSSETKDSTTQAEIVEAELENGLEELIEQELGGELELGTGDNSTLGNSVEDYAVLYGDSIANSRPASVTISYADLDGDTAIFNYEYESVEVRLVGTIEIEVDVI